MSAQDYYKSPYPRRETSGKATAALILGICGFVVFPFIPSVVAVVLGTQARTEITQSRGRLGGSGLARVGVILGWVGAVYGAVILLIVALMFGWVLSSPWD